MRKAIILVLLIVLGTMPLQTSAQTTISVPAVDLQCENAITGNEPSEGPLAWIDSYASGKLENGSDDPNALTDTANCRVVNPNAYAERIQIQVSADGLAVAAPGTISLGPGEEESFNVTVRADQMLSPSVRTLTITATVVEANGAPPPNVAESQVVGDIYISTNYKDYGYNGCAIFDGGYPSENWNAYGIPDYYLYQSLNYAYINLTIQQIISIENTSGNATQSENESTTYDNTTVDLGNVTIRLNRTAAPFHSQNFFTLTKMGCYDQVPFHRVIDGFVIQGGDFESGSGSGGNAAFWAGYCNGKIADQNGTNYTAHTCPTRDWSLPSEHTNGLRHGVGSLAAAHAGLNTDGSQFYIVPSDSNPCWLDGDQEQAPNGGGCVEVDEKDCSSQSCYTVFGEVISGMQIIDAISDLATGANDRPIHDVIIKQAVQVWNFEDADGDGTPDDFDDFPNDANETTDSDGDGLGDNSDAFPDDANETHDNDADGVGNNSDAFPDDPDETHDDDGDGVGNNSDAFPDDPDETHDDDGDGVGNNTDEFPQDPDEQFDDDDDGVGNNEDAFPDNPYASNWATIYAAVGTLIVLLIGAGVMISRMKKQDELPNVASSIELQQLDKQIEELQQKKNEMIGQEDPTELMFEE